VGKIVVCDCNGSLRRHFFTFASNAVSQRRRSAQALITLASPLLRLLSNVPTLPSRDQIILYYLVLQGIKGLFIRSEVLFNVLALSSPLDNNVTTFAYLQNLVVSFIYI